MELVVSKLYFLTSLERPYGPCGWREGGIEFHLPIENGGVVRFFARAGNYVNALGVYVRSN